MNLMKIIKIVVFKIIIYLKIILLIQIAVIIWTQLKLKTRKIYIKSSRKTQKKQKNNYCKNRKNKN